MAPDAVAPKPAPRGRGDRLGAADRARRAALIAGAALTVLIGGAVTSWSVARSDVTRLPDATTVADQNRQLAAELRSTDVIRTVPLWWDDGRLGLDRAEFLLSRSPDPYDLLHFERVVFVTSDDYIDAARTEARAAGLTDWDVRHGASGYAVATAEIAPKTTLVWDGFAALGDADVTKHRGFGSPTSCDRWIDDGWHCGAYNEFIFVGRGFREMDDTYRRCIVANAPEGGSEWRIRWEDVPAGSLLRVRAGNTFLAHRLPRGAPVRFQLLLNDQPVIEREFPISAAGYPELQVPLRARPGAELDVEFRVSSPDHLDRFFCFRPQIVGALPAADVAP